MVGICVWVSQFSIWKVLTKTPNELVSWFCFLFLSRKHFHCVSSTSLTTGWMFYVCRSSRTQNCIFKKSIKRRNLHVFAAPRVVTGKWWSLHDGKIYVILFHFSACILYIVKYLCNLHKKCSPPFHSPTSIPFDSHAICLTIQTDVIYQSQINVFTLVFSLSTVHIKLMAIKQKFMIIERSFIFTLMCVIRW